MKGDAVNLDLMVGVVREGAAWNESHAKEDNANNNTESDGGREGAGRGAALGPAPPRRVPPAGGAICRLLVASRAEVECKDYNESTPLMVAC